VFAARRLLEDVAFKSWLEMRDGGVKEVDSSATSESDGFGSKGELFVNASGDEWALDAVLLLWSSTTSRALMSELS